MADSKKPSNISIGPGGRVGTGGGRGPGARMMPGEKAADAKGAAKRLVKYIGESKKIFIGLIIVVLAVTGIGLLGPALQERAIDTLTFTEDQPVKVDFDRLLMYLGIMLVTYACSALFTYLQSILAARLTLRTVSKMRGDLFRKLARLPISYTDSHRHGDIMSRMTNDVENISNSVSTSIASLVSGVVTIIGVVIIMLMYSPILTLVSMITIPCTILATSLITKVARKYFVEQQKYLGAINAEAEEMITGYKTVTAFSRQKRAIADFSVQSENLKRCSIKAQIFGGVMGPVMNVIGNISYLLIAGVGGYLALKGDIRVGVIQAFLLYSKQFTRPINEIAHQYTAIQTALAGAERIFEILDTPDEINQGTKLLGDPKDVRGEIHFEHVNFSYIPGERVLKDFSLDINAGEKVAIVGATGSGKTTVVNLLLRFYDIDDGFISVDGLDLYEIDKNDLRRDVGIVLQDTVLFSDTIEGNIRYGKTGATLDEIKAACVTAEADRFISLLPEGYQTKLSESGSNLSGGQRQLLAIARAVLSDTPILVLDEATSSVDTRTEMQISMAMNALMEGRTSIIIAHRLSTIRNADKIVVIDAGRVAEIGNHDELLAKGGVYSRLYQSQFAGEET